MHHKDCPNCQRPIGWDNAAIRCSECGGIYCVECAERRLGLSQPKCPRCGSLRWSAVA